MSGACVPAGKLFDLPRDSISNLYEVLRHEEGGAPRRTARSDASADGFPLAVHDAMNLEIR
jgi:hypothetical protein